jgi:hypothetical protein
LHPWNSTAGYIIKTGEDKNFNPDVRCVGQTIVVVCNDGHGVLSRFQIPLSQSRTDVTVPAVTTSPPPPPEETPVSYPDCKPLVESVRAKFPAGPMEKSIQGRFLIAVVHAIHRAHPTLRPGLHKKSGSNSYPLPNDVRVDGDLVVFPDGHLFDVLGKEETESTPAWIDEGVHPNSIPAYYDVLTHFPVEEPPPPPTDCQEYIEALAERDRQLDEARDLLLEQAELLEVCQTAREQQAGELIMLKAEIERLKNLPCECVLDKGTAPSWAIRFFEIKCKKAGG